MELDYRYAESTVKPSALEINDGTVYLRKDYSEIVRTSEQSEEVTYWTYQEAQITTQEFNEYVNMLMAQNAIKGQNDSENIISLMVGQENNDSNQLAVMEAIADLYEMLLPMYEVPVMVSLYCTLIINKRRTFDQVPEKIQGEVETRLRELGYDVNGDPVAGEV